MSLMWPFNRRKSHLEEVVRKLKKFEYAQLRIELGIVNDSCSKKATWIVPVHRRLGGV